MGKTVDEQHTKAARVLPFVKIGQCKKGKSVNKSQYADPKHQSAAMIKQSIFERLLRCHLCAAN